VAGWAVTLFLVVRHPFRRREKWAWQAVTGSVAVWVILDVAVCVASGVWGELVFVSAAAAGLALPLALTRRAF